MVVRTEGRIDASSRMVNVVIEVDDPFEFVGDRPGLVPGMYIGDVAIQGREIKSIFRIADRGLRNGREVWVANDSKLHVREVTLVRRDGEYAYISEGLKDGDVVTTSLLDAPIEGMSIRTEMSDGTK